MSEDFDSSLEEQEVVVDIQEDPYEEEAKAQGWRKKEEFHGDPNKWKPAKEFVERGELFGKIDTMGRELKETKKALRMLQDHHAQVKQVEYNKALVELKALQKKHLEEGNSDGYLETSDLLTDLKAEQKARQVVVETTPQQIDPRFIQWIDNNKWYEKEPEMRRYADMIGQGYAAQNPGIDPEDVLVFVTKEIKTKYKDKFVNPNREKPSSVSSSSTTSVSADTFSLSEDEKKVMNTFIRNGVMTKEEYIKELKSMRGVV